MSTNPVHALEAAHYTDPTLFERKQERIFRRTWQFAGHVSRLERPGDYFALEQHGRSLFCVKDREGVVRSECYHCGLNHPTFSNGVVEADSYDIVPPIAALHEWLGEAMA